MPWECPRCGVIHADYISQCNCPSPSATFASNSIPAAYENASMGWYEGWRKCEKCGHMLPKGQDCFCSPPEIGVVVGTKSFPPCTENNDMKKLEEKMSKLDETCRNLHNRIITLEISESVNKLKNTRIIELEGLNVLAFPMSNITGGNVVIRGKRVISGIVHCKHISEEYVHKTTQMTIYKKDKETDKTLKLVLQDVCIRSYDENDYGYTAAIMASGFVDWTPCDFVEDVEHGSVCTESPCATKDFSHNLLKQLDCVREAGQRLCASIEYDTVLKLNDSAKSALCNLAVYCGCTHVPWWHGDTSVEENSNCETTYDE